MRREGDTEGGREGGRKHAVIRTDEFSLKIELGDGGPGAVSGGGGREGGREGGTERMSASFVKRPIT